MNWVICGFRNFANNAIEFRALFTTLAGLHKSIKIFVDFYFCCSKFWFVPNYSRSYFEFGENSFSKHFENFKFLVRDKELVYQTKNKKIFKIFTVNNLRFAQMGNCNTVGPNEALVISGGCCGGKNKKYIHGGYGWSWWFVTDVQTISLEIMTLIPHVQQCETAQGILFETFPTYHSFE